MQEDFINLAADISLIAQKCEIPPSLRCSKLLILSRPIESIDQTSIYIVIFFNLDYYII